MLASTGGSFGERNENGKRNLSNDEAEEPASERRNSRKTKENKRIHGSALKETKTTKDFNDYFHAESSEKNRGTIGESPPTYDSFFRDLGGRIMHGHSAQGGKTSDERSLEREEDSKETRPV